MSILRFASSLLKKIHEHRFLTTFRIRVSGLGATISRDKWDQGTLYWVGHWEAPHRQMGLGGRKCGMFEKSWGGSGRVCGVGRSREFLKSERARCVGQSMLQ